LSFVLSLINNTHPALAELLGDLVMADSLAGHDTPILARFSYLSRTTDVMNDDIFSRSGACDGFAFAFRSRWPNLLAWPIVGEK